MPVGLVLS
uniref:Leader protein n=1 Tax=Murine hepatitis virus TaxID=11138 RepID=Q89498_9BETC|nr:leader protein [Murine hepatitis virus]AAA91862.1 unknown [Murine hepatitis virus]